MPKIEKILTLEITPERFLNACSLNELYEIELLLSSAIRRAKVMNGEDFEPININKKNSGNDKKSIS